MSTGLDTRRTDGGLWQRSAKYSGADADPNFNLTSGLQGTSSDLLLAGQLKTANGWSLAGRGLLDGDFSFAKAELRAGWQKKVAAINGSYVWQEPDPAENVNDEISEVRLTGRYTVDQNWENTGLGAI